MNASASAANAIKRPASFLPKNGLALWPYGRNPHLCGPVLIALLARRGRSENDGDWDRMDLFIRAIGIARATTKISMANIVCNIKRLLVLRKAELTPT